MSIIHFSHANGFPANSYSSLFGYLKGHEISKINIIGENKIASELEWNGLADDLISHLMNHDEPVIGVGHSFGGVITLLAAAKHPELFKHVILLDPPLFSPFKRSLVKILRTLGIEDYASPARKSKNRRDTFETKEFALEYFKSKTIFKNFEQKSLENYVQHGLKESHEGVELEISVEKEVSIFRNMLIKFPETIYSVSGTLLYAAIYPILWKSDLAWIQKEFNNFEIMPYPGTHLYPLETPESLANMILRVVTKVNIR